jgi:hypothetical protein
MMHGAIERETSREIRTEEFFANWRRIIDGLPLEEKGVYATIAACVVAGGKGLQEEYICRKCGTNMRKWKRLKDRLIQAGALIIEPDGTIMVAVLKNRLYKSGYLYIKDQIPTKLRWQVFQRDNYQCRKCGCREDLTVDHIIAEINGGETVLDNLQTLCRPCNSGKGAR